MKRTWVMAVGSALAVLLVGSGEAEGQGRSDREPSLFELGVYGGGAYSTDWYQTRTASSTGGVVTENDDEEGRRIGFAPIFGANATFYGLPWFGVRLHYGYMPSDLPEGTGDASDGAGGASGFFVNNHFYDLSLVFRASSIPLFSSLVSNGYVWLGGGGLTTDIAGEGPACAPGPLAEGACLSVDPDHASVGQAVFGIGGDLISISSNVGLFAELAAHVYDSPAHTGDGFVPRVIVQPGEPFRVADDQYAVTPQLVAGVKLAFGGREPQVVAVPAPVTPPAPVAPAPPAPPRMREVSVCVVQGSGLEEVVAMVDPATGDTTVSGRAFGVAYPSAAPTYASTAPWYISNDSISVAGEEYVRFGVARVITPASQLIWVGEFNGTPIFAQTGEEAPQKVLYVPLRPGCQFQPYQLREDIRVRG